MPKEALVVLPNNWQGIIKEIGAYARDNKTECIIGGSLGIAASTGTPWTPQRPDGSERDLDCLVCGTENQRLNFYSRFVLPKCNPLIDMGIGYIFEFYNDIIKMRIGCKLVEINPQILKPRIIRIDSLEIPVISPKIQLELIKAKNPEPRGKMVSRISTLTNYLNAHPEENGLFSFGDMWPIRQLGNYYKCEFLFDKLRPTIFNLKSHEMIRHLVNLCKAMNPEMWQKVKSLLLHDPGLRTFNRDGRC